MAESNSDARHRALHVFVAEHRDQLEAYTDNDKETAWLAEAVLAWARLGQQSSEGIVR